MENGWGRKAETPHARPSAAHRFRCGSRQRPVWSCPFRWQWRTERRLSSQTFLPPGKEMAIRTGHGIAPATQNLNRRSAEEGEKCDEQREDAQSFRDGEAEDQAAELAVGGRRIAKSA